MKYLKLSIILIAVALFSMGLASTGYAFHSGGVAECEGCHTMHNSFEGVKMTVNALTPGTTNNYLLIGSDQSSTCLNCHNQPDTAPSSYHISTDESKLAPGVPPVEETPGGDFAWLKKSYTWSSGTSIGERHGHNIVANDFNYLVDNIQKVAPGGSYPASSLSCISCHDPHGKYRRDLNGVIATTGKPIRSSGSYNTSADPDANFSVGVFRLLAGNGYSPDSLGGANAFTNDSPAAVAPSTYNRTEAVTQTRVAYGKGMSEWCANCHTNMHNDNYPSTLRHPAGNAAKLGATISNNYNIYVKSGDVTGTSATSFTSLVPFEEGVADQSIASYTQLKGHALNTDTQLGGPDATNSNVACVTCHRAHASGWDSMTRFTLDNEFMVGADSTGNPVYPGTDSAYVNTRAAQGRTVAETSRAYYDRPATKFSAYQRDLCNKCHIKD
jgi:hypothetical protein